MRPTQLLALLLAASLAGCSRPSEAAGEASQETVAGGPKLRERPRVRVAEVERREMVQRLETTSVLESEGEVQLFPRRQGVVVEVLAEEGDRVSAGDVLARLDDRDEVLSLRDAEVGLDEAQSTLEQRRLAIEEAEGRLRGTVLTEEQAARDHARNEKLFAGGDDGRTASALSRKALEDSKLALDNAISEKEQAEIAVRRAKVEAAMAEIAVSRAQVALERARLAVEQMRIEAPFDGIVASRNVRVGANAGQTDAAYVLTETVNLRAVFFRPQEELDLFEGAASSGTRGSAASRLALSATAEAHPGRSFEGYIERISPTIDAASGQFRVTARLHDAPDDDVELLPGMLVRLSIVTDRHKDTLAIPKRALRREGDRRYVLVVESGSRVRRVDVEEGYDDDELVEVLPLEQNALEPGLQVVSVGRRDLVDGDAVQVEDAHGVPQRVPDAREDEPAGSPVAEAAPETSTEEAAPAGAVSDEG